MPMLNLFSPNYNDTSTIQQYKTINTDAPFQKFTPQLLFPHKDHICQPYHYTKTALLCYSAHRCKHIFCMTASVNSAVQNKTM